MKAHCKACGTYFELEADADPQFMPDICDDCEDRGFEQSQDIEDFSDADAGL